LELALTKRRAGKAEMKLVKSRTTASQANRGKSINVISIAEVFNNIGLFSGPYYLRALTRFFADD
jgi:hypothetical protein